METLPAKTENGTAMPDQPLETRSPEEIIHWLQTNRTPLEMVETREGRGGQEFYYLRHQYVTETLNRITRFDWDFRILRERLEEDQITVLGELTVRIGEIEITKTQYGSSSAKRSGGKPLSIGDDFKGAASDALKKCASLIGLGLDLSLPIQDGTRKRMHAVGKKAFGDAWDKKCHWAVRIITGGRHRNKSISPDSSNQLLDVEARVLADVMDGSLTSDLARELAAKLKSK